MFRAVVVDSAVRARTRKGKRDEEDGRMMDVDWVSRKRMAQVVLLTMRSSPSVQQMQWQ